MGDTARNFIKIRSRGDAETTENIRLALKIYLLVFKHVQTNELAVIQRQCKYFCRLFSVFSAPPREVGVYDDLTRIATSLYTQHHLY
jgi:hypothetical protein